MPKMLLLVLTLVSLPGLALAEPGSGTDRTRVNTAVEAMQRDGRWERLIAEGRANKRAFEDLRQAEQRVQTPTATGSVGARPRR
jgi:hypothetical protein